MPGEQLSQPQPPPQLEQVFPDFLSLTILRITRATTPTTMSKTIIVPAFIKIPLSEPGRDESSSSAGICLNR